MFSKRSKFEPQTLKRPEVQVELEFQRYEEFPALKKKLFQAKKV